MSLQSSLSPSFGGMSLVMCSPDAMKNGIATTSSIPSAAICSMVSPMNGWDVSLNPMYTFSNPIFSKRSFCNSMIFLLYSYLDPCPTINVAFLVIISHLGNRFICQFSDRVSGLHGNYVIRSHDHGMRRYLAQRPFESLVKKIR